MKTVLLSLLVLFLGSCKGVDGQSTQKESSQDLTLRPFIAIHKGDTNENDATLMVSIPTAMNFTGTPQVCIDTTTIEFSPLGQSRYPSMIPQKVTTSCSIVHKAVLIEGTQQEVVFYTPIRDVINLSKVKVTIKESESSSKEHIFNISTGT